MNSPKHPRRSPAQILKKVIDDNVDTPFTWIANKYIMLHLHRCFEREKKKNNLHTNLFNLGGSHASDILLVPPRKKPTLPSEQMPNMVKDRSAELAQNLTQKIPSFVRPTAKIDGFELWRQLEGSDL